MIKSIALAYRKKGLTREEYNKYWKDTHGPMAAKMIPGLRRYVQNHFITVPGREYAGDGIVEMWYDDMEAFQKSTAYLQSEEGKALVEDGAKFAEMPDGGYFWIVEEHVIKDDIG